MSARHQLVVHHRYNRYNLRMLAQTGDITGDKLGTLLGTFSFFVNYLIIEEDGKAFTPRHPSHY